MPSPGDPILARRAGILVLPVLALACLVTTIVIEAGLPSAIPGDDLAPDPGWGTATTGLLIGVLAAAVLLKDPRQVFGWALGWVALFWALDGVAESYVRLGLDQAEAMPGQTFATWFLLRFTALLPATLAVALLLFPDGRLLPGRWRQAGLASLALLCLSALVFVVVPSSVFPDDGRLPPGADPDATTIWALEPWTDPLLAAARTLTLLAALVPVAAVVARYRRSVGLERDRMRWLLWGVIVMVLAVAAAVLVGGEALDRALYFVAINTPPLAMTVAVVAPRLVAIDDLLSRTLLYGALSVLVVAVDLAVLAGLTAVLGDSLDRREVVLVALLVAVAVYGPLRSRLRSAVRRLVLGSRGTPYDVVAGLASTLETTDEGPAQLAAVAGAVADAFAVGFVRVEVERGGGERLIATHGREPDETRTLPITYRGATVGRLVLPARGLRSRLSRRDEELLGDLVRQAATAARTSRLADELQLSRERLVTAREEERRRIRRDLHDGLGPSLSGVVFQLEAARLAVDADPGAAKQQLAASSALVQDVVADVRRLVHDLRPPALDDRGLVGALRQQAEHLAGPTAVVEAEDLGTLPAAVEVAAYRIASEALANVARHASADHARVRLARDEGVLVVTVTDDGVGIPTGAESGIGLVSMRERAAELGGTVDVRCPEAGGTVVTARLPIRQEEP